MCGSDEGIRGGLTDALEVYNAAKELGSEDLVCACVERVWALRDEWLGAVQVGDMERECAWMYTLL